MTAIDEVEELLGLSHICDLVWSGYALCTSFLAQTPQLDILYRLNNSDTTEVEIRQGGKLTTLASVAIGQNIEVRIVPPRGAAVCLARDQNDLLAVFRLHCLPENYALMDSGFRTWGPSGDVVVPAVVEASDLLKRLEGEAIIETAGNRFALLTYDQKIYITHGVHSETVERSAQVVRRGLNILNQMLADTIHTAEKKRIIRNAIIASLKSCDEANRLSHLLSHCDEIFENAQHNYELFISNFSFNNDLDKLHEQKREFSVKLNGLLIGIQGKLLAIPVSTILATTQLKDSSDSSYVTINLAVLASSLIFFVIIIWLIRSQMIAINSIKLEVQQKERRFRLELPKLFEEVRLIFSSLTSDCNLNLNMARSLIALSTVLTLVTVYVFWVKTPAVSLWLSPAYEVVMQQRPCIMIVLLFFDFIAGVDKALLWCCVKIHLLDKFHSRMARS
ncbi:hypothetical protein [Pseudomonas soli]|uniref:hypothetical protein n=1 Tax=Pseudomonas soli TaxID=1306993 RepID=UPI0003C79A81|nr:hypothetical protein [Pseudomonas putida]